MTIQAGSRVLALLLLMSGVGACASYSDVRFAPAIQDTDLRGEAGDLQARVAVAWRSVEEREGVPELRFRVRVENTGPTPFTLVPAEFELLDGALSSFGPPRAVDLPVVVDSGQSIPFDLAFPVPGEGLGAFDLSSLTLGVKLQGGRWNWSTTFQRAEPPHDHSPWSFNFGVGWVFH